MTNPYYTPGGTPGARSGVNSSPMRTEFAAIGTAFDGVHSLLWAKDGSVNPTANIPMAGFKFTGLAAGAASGQALIFGQALLANQFYLHPTIQIIGGATGVTAIPVAVAGQGGGGLLLIRGADVAGNAFCALYLLAVKVLLGGGTDVSSTLLARVGSADPAITSITNSGGFVAVTVSGVGANSCYVTGFGF